MRRDEEGRTVLDVAEDFEDLDLPLGLLLVLVDVRQHLKEGRNRHYRGVISKGLLKIRLVA